jgi:hypothetical protein
LLNRGTALLAGAAVLTAIVVVALTVLSPSSSPTGLAGGVTGGPPWSANNTDANALRARMIATGLPPQTMEGQVLHIHDHLDVYVDGKHVTVPANIGISTSQGFLAALHTHDTTGIIHVESPVQEDFTLGQFFDVWGVDLGSTGVGGAVQPGGGKIAAFVNGKALTGNPQDLVLAPHQEICICVGQLPSSIPSSYAFPAGL